MVVAHHWLAALHKSSQIRGAKVALALSGGGIQALSSLFSVPGASWSLLEAHIPYGQQSLAEYIGHMPQQYCSTTTAAELAQAAFLRALTLHTRDRGLLNAVDPTAILGISCTAALATDTPKRGPHQVHVASTTWSHTDTYSCNMVKDGKRSREQEDAIASSIVLQALADALTDIGAAPMASRACMLPITRRDCDSDSDSDTPLEEVAHSRAGSSSQRPGAMRCVMRHPHTQEPVVINNMAPPPGSIVLAASFNPVHHGHIGVAEAACAAMAQRTGQLPAGVVFELSVGNADKPTIDDKEALRRAQAVTARNVRLPGGVGRADLPECVPGVAYLTNVPLFVDKAAGMPGCVFAVGYDTAARLVQPRYYNNSVAQMAKALQDIERHGCSFVVAGRLDTASGRFLTLDDVLNEMDAESKAAVPPSLFQHGLSEAEFRVDVSSTELRKAQARGGEE